MGQLVCCQLALTSASATIEPTASSPLVLVLRVLPRMTSGPRDECGRLDRSASGPCCGGPVVNRPLVRAAVTTIKA